MSPAHDPYRHRDLRRIIFPAVSQHLPGARFVAKRPVILHFLRDRYVYRNYTVRSGTISNDPVRLPPRGREHGRRIRIKNSVHRGNERTTPAVLSVLNRVIRHRWWIHPLAVLSFALIRDLAIDSLGEEALGSGVRVEIIRAFLAADRTQEDFLSIIESGARGGSHARSAASSPAKPTTGRSDQAEISGVHWVCVSDS